MHIHHCNTNTHYALQQFITYIQKNIYTHLHLPTKYN